MCGFSFHIKKLLGIVLKKIHLFDVEKNRNLLSKLTNNAGMSSIDTIER